MRHQRILKELSIFRLTLRKMGALYFVPYAFLYLLIPLLGIGYLLYHTDGENARGLIFYDFQKFIPFMSVWWILFGLDDYVEGDASELLRVYKRSLLPEFWLMFAWYLLHVAVLFLAFGVLLENYWRDFPLIVTQSLAFSSVAFCLLCATRTLMAPFLVTLLYEVFAILSNFGVLGQVNMFSLQRMETISDYLLPYSVIFFVSCVIPFLGNCIYKKRN